jgi:hypothetical protein
MIILCVALAVLLCATASAASYFIATSLVLAKVVKDQKRQHRRDVRRSDALLNRLVMRHGFTPLTEPATTKDTSAVVTLPIADPFEAAEKEWEREDRERLQRMTALDDDEKSDLIAEARRRVN